ncbi:hypothetical protein MUN89_08250 [Halobacillus salinarum]|uniref:DUF3953 domain-containing protein n=1 Tax=Halobacillus salinarum TaxID=2932257 RepID=A0ABY4EP17_9BACI|nr:hypothetical protein [Halobacillus salinarum]UOQ45898.1 hypothetical protein MUN89_08250 [Halobacillus salinarum]
MKGSKGIRYLLMAMGHGGLLLLGLALMRFVVIFDDQLGNGLILFGLLFVGSYLGYMEKEAGITRKESAIGTLGLIAAFLILTMYFYV